MTKPRSMNIKELSSILDTEVEKLDVSLKNRLKRYQAIPTKFPFHFSYGDSLADFFVIARSDKHVLFYQEFEEEFGTGTIGQDGIVRDWGTYPSLHVAISNFPESLDKIVRTARNFSERDSFEREWLIQNTWCDQCNEADIGMKDPQEYEENGTVYVEGTCLRCGKKVRSSVEERSAG